MPRFYNSTISVSLCHCIYPKDSINRTYTFLLAPGATALVGSGGIGSDHYPYFGQVAVINNKDTVHLDRKSLKLKRRFMSLE
ncbi:MAG TPA: hypothetical protein VG738_11795 [Chitinophagaceae bacterium]|nr:hypothetical protein [Chitinophagaceae bacterium]